MQRRGLWLTEDGERINYKIPATDLDHLPDNVDCVFVTLKSQSIPSVVPQLKQLLNRDHAMMVTVVNGIPWWFFYRLERGFEDKPVKSVDPQAALWEQVGPERTIGCVVYPSIELTKPGEIVHLSDTRMPIGEPDNQSSERLQQLADIMDGAGIRTPRRRDIRNEIWIKVWGNLAFNPLSVITGKTLDLLATEEETRRRAASVMAECVSVGEAYGARFGMSIDKRIAGAAAVGAHKTSMLQDFERGKELESAGIVDAIIELADLAKVPVPKIRELQIDLETCVKQRA